MSKLGLFPLKRPIPGHSASPSWTSQVLRLFFFTFFFPQKAAIDNRKNRVCGELFVLKPLIRHEGKNHTYKERSQGCWRYFTSVKAFISPFWALMPSPPISAPNGTYTSQPTIALSVRSWHRYLPEHSYSTLPRSAFAGCGSTLYSLSFAFLDDFLVANRNSTPSTPRIPSRPFYRMFFIWCGLSA